MKAMSLIRIVTRPRAPDEDATEFSSPALTRSEFEWPKPANTQDQQAGQRQRKSRLAPNETV